MTTRQKHGRRQRALFIIGTALGFPQKRMADDAGCSPKTVAEHLAQASRRFGMPNHTAAWTWLALAACEHFQMVETGLMSE